MNYMNSTIGMAAALAVVVTTGVLQGCAQQQYQASNCELSPSKNVDQLFAEVQDRLGERSCHVQFHGYVEQLVAAAKGSPGEENEKRFAELVRTTIERGIISGKQGKEIFSRYFDPEFYAVKTEPRANCSALNGRAREALYVDMKQELGYKREGLLEMLGDEQRFRAAQQHYQDLNIVLDAVSMACDAPI